MPLAESNTKVLVLFESFLKARVFFNAIIRRDAGIRLVQTMEDFALYICNIQYLFVKEPLIQFHEDSHTWW